MCFLITIVYLPFIITLPLLKKKSTMIIAISVLVLVILAVFGIAIHYCLDKKPAYTNLTGKHVIVTGGSSGIGKAVAQEAANLGAHVTVIGRDVAKLTAAVEEIVQKSSATKDQKVQYASLDVTSSFETIEQSLSKLERDIGPIFMLVNCAGMCICGRFEDMNAADIKTMIDLNYFGTAYPTKYVLPGMKKRNEGIIVFVSTEAALLGIYGLSAYSGAKWAVRGLAEALVMELVGTKVSLTLAFPPDTDTPGLKQEYLTKPKETKLITGTGGLQDPEVVGKQMVHDALSAKTYSVFGATGHMMTLLSCGSIDGVTQVLTQIFSMGLLRVIMAAIVLSFHKIVRDGLKERGQTESAKDK